MDARTDIWSFGCVLYEILTGRMAFGGPTVTDILSAIVSREPDWDALPSATPPNIRRPLQRLLAKDPKRRLRHIGDARLEIEDTASATAAVARREPASHRAPWAIGIATAVVALLLASVALAHLVA